MSKRNALHRSYGGLLCSAVLVAALAVPAHGFKPKDPLGHQDIVREALRGQPFRTRDGLNIFFDESVIEMIAAADAAVDDGAVDRFLRGRCRNKRQEFCLPAAHCDDELLAQCSDRVLMIRSSLLALNPLTADIGKARRDFGRALHTIQDFYAHSNWVNKPGPARTKIQPNLGMSRLPPAPAGITCDPSAGVLAGAGLTQLTSGYFRFPRLGDEPMPVGKCAHGVPLLSAGINKDEPDRPFFQEARELAVLHTREYVREIFSQWDEGGMTSLMHEFAAPNSTLGVVVDATGSMAPELSGLREAAAELRRDADGLGSPDHYLVSPAPTTGTARLLRTGTELEEALSELGMQARESRADSPEPRLLQAIAAAPSSSALFFYTNRCSGPSGELAAATAAARERQTAVHVVFTQSCPATEGPYRRLAQQSGGQLLRAAATEVALTTAWMRPWLGAQPQLLLQESGQLAGAERVFELTVDSTVRELNVSAAADALQGLRIHAPGGGDVSSSGRSTPVSNSVLWSITQPAPGTWTVHLRGAGAFEVRALAQTPIRAGRFELLEERDGRHEGNLFPLQGPAQAGPGSVETALYGPASDVRFELHAGSGEALQRFSLEEGQAEYSRNRFRGSVTLPAGSLWVHARGVDPAGYPFVRVFPQPLDVQIAAPSGGRHPR